MLEKQKQIYIYIYICYHMASCLQSGASPDSMIWAACQALLALLSGPVGCQKRPCDTLTTVGCFGNKKTSIYWVCGMPASYITSLQFVPWEVLVVSHVSSPSPCPFQLLLHPFPSSFPQIPCCATAGPAHGQQSSSPANTTSLDLTTAANRNCAEKQIQRLLEASGNI